jgi:broad specificity phosphatase PhoE
MGDFYLIRHAQSTWNAARGSKQKNVESMIDAELTENGVRQAE